MLNALGSTHMAAFADEVAIEAHQRLLEFSNGVQQYWTYERSQPVAHGADCIWTDGSTRLLDYGGMGAPLLIIPSLINRYHVLDLSAGHNFVNALKEGGYRPYMVDWDAPGPAEMTFDLSAYVIQRLEPALDRVCETTGVKSIGIVGYCMGGLLATALAARRPDQAAGLVLLATPWDFHAGQSAQIGLLKTSLPQINLTIDALGEMPVDVLQAMFAGLSPWLTIDKFRRFSKMRMNTTKTDAFVELEDWLNNGVPLVPAVARECLNEWYGENTPYNGEWKVGGITVDPATISQPVLIAIPEADHIVPPQSATALAERMPDSQIIYVSAGHIGMVAGAQAKSSLMRPLLTWLGKNLSNHQK